MNITKDDLATAVRTSALLQAENLFRVLFEGYQIAQADRVDAAKTRFVNGLKDLVAAHSAAQALIKTSDAA